MERKAERNGTHGSTVITIGSVRLGHDPFPVIAGPCAIESEEQMETVADAAVEYGASLLRGNAYKPASSPYDFHGLGSDGLDLLAAAGRRVGLPTVTQVTEAVHAEEIAQKVDVLEVASANMQDFELLRVLGRLGKPVLLRRGPSATLDEWLWSAEYVLAEGNEQVVLVERGIRTFGTGRTDMLDINSVPSLRELTHLPIIVDPSHAAGGASRVRPLALAAQGVGADGLIVEVHPTPEIARSSDKQLGFGPFSDLMVALGIHRMRTDIDQIDRQIVRLLGRRQDLSQRIGEVKHERGMPVQIPDREAELLDIIRKEAVHHGLEPEHVADLFGRVLSESRRLQHEMRAETPDA